MFRVRNPHVFCSVGHWKYRCLWLLCGIHSSSSHLQMLTVCLVLQAVSSVTQSYPTLWPHGLQHARSCPWIATFQYPLYYNGKIACLWVHQSLDLETLFPNWCRKQCPTQDPEILDFELRLLTGSTSDWLDSFGKGWVVISVERKKCWNI